MSRLQHDLVLMASNLPLGPMSATLSLPCPNNQSGLDAYLFLKELRVRYGRKPIWTDEGVWYPEACRMLRLEHHVYPVQWKNLMERINRPLKDRLENFDDLFQCLKEGCDLSHVTRWLNLFVDLHYAKMRHIIRFGNLITFLE
jgi:transposase-like protein